MLFYQIQISFREKDDDSRVFNELKGRSMDVEIIDMFFFVIRSMRREKKEKREKRKERELTHSIDEKMRREFDVE